MIRSNIGNSEVITDRKWRTFILSSPFSVVMGVIALLFTGVMIARMMGGLSETFELYTQRIPNLPLMLFAGGFITYAMIMALLLILRRNALAATVVIATNLYVDFYLGLAVVSEAVAVVVLLIFFLARSPQFPWERPRVLWLWWIFLVISIMPAMRGLNLSDGAYYYITIISGPFVMFWLGTVIARDSENMRRLFICLSILATLIAIHTIIEFVTGIFLLKTAATDDQLAYGYYRAESFLRNPDSAGGFFGVMLPLPLALFIESSSLWKKVLYFAEMCLILLALLFTYSTGGWVGALAGICAFTILVGRIRYRLLIPLSILAAVVVILYLFPSQVAQQIQHATAPHDLLLRSAIWQTGLNVIRAFPLTGIGLGRKVYIVRADPYRVPGQYLPVDHPHNSYLELAALGGIPVLLVFTVILSYALARALRNWRSSDARNRALLAGGIASVVALSVYSLSNAGWTLVPLAAIGWIILGASSSPLLSKNHNDETMRKKNELLTVRRKFATVASESEGQK